MLGERIIFELYGDLEWLDQISRDWKSTAESVGRSSVCQHLANERVDWMSGGRGERRRRIVSKEERERVSGQIGIVNGFGSV